MNLPLLRGLLREIRIELQFENFLQQSGLHHHSDRDNKYFKSVDIFSDVGYNDFTKAYEPDCIQDVL